MIARHSPKDLGGPAFLVLRIGIIDHDPITPVARGIQPAAVFIFDRRQIDYRFIIVVRAARLRTGDAEAGLWNRPVFAPVDEGPAGAFDWIRIPSL